MASMLMVGRVRLRRASRGMLERLGLRKPWPLGEALDRMTDAEREAFFESIGLWEGVDASLAEHRAQKSTASGPLTTRD